MADAPNGDGYAHNFDRRLDRMNDYLQAMTDSFLEHHRVVMEEIRAMRDSYRQQHLETMEEIRELLLLQREHRIDIMALFQVGKDVKNSLEKEGL